ncbi:MAG: DUF1573 domain-containing protein [Thermoflavifilum aggregans]|uniref:DUF1573 domain-containing protein n=1 Tax=Thermoflavifilum thermophilum TaxID=1393122 RepID=A0A1I7N2W1_9BACT|nr:DUF1573 domain-containing protein [Thermoflavifilum thermophilum]MBX6380482.1 DUF1573 domain-containing protein [Thermoflavifilum aggregans]SFV29001.1 Protein of unknown function [Thermoflavifilum thermophilum]
MKKLILSLSMLLGALLPAMAQTASSAQSSDPFAGKVKFNQETIDFGTTKLNHPVSVTFVFKNVGNTPLIIENVRPSCGCTTPSYTQEPVLPGKEGKIVATYNAAVLGEASKTVSVKFKGIDQELDLHFTGKVVQ